MAHLKHMARRIVEEVYGQGKVEVLDELCHPGYVSHDPLSGDADLAGEKAYVRLMHACFPNLEARILDLFAEGDTVITRWRLEGNLARPLLGVEPHGQRITLEGMTISQFEDGKLVEDMSQWDTFGYLRQLGLVQPLGARAESLGGREGPESSQA
jgi:predicted ester cyclase